MPDLIKIERLYVDGRIRLEHPKITGKGGFWWNQLAAIANRSAEETDEAFDARVQTLYDNSGEVQMLNQNKIEVRSAEVAALDPLLSISQVP